MANVFSRIGAQKPRLNPFDLSYYHLTTADMGQLIPVYWQEGVPGDVFKISNEVVIRMQPLVAPVLHPIGITVHYFSIPVRLLWEQWEDFITGGQDGDFTGVPPKWIPPKKEDGTYDLTDFGKYSLWDYFGLPIFAPTTAVIDEENCPIDWLRRSINMTWNEYYRDENLQAEIPLTNNKLLRRAWKKDYLTSALPWQQRGVSPSIPLTGLGFADFTDVVNASLFYQGGQTVSDVGIPAGASGNAGFATMETSDTEIDSIKAALKEWLNQNKIDFGEAATFTTNDLRNIVQLQRWLELNARGGARYTEWLKAHFGVSPSDARLQRPEYIGGTFYPVIVSEVLQTSETAASPQGNMAGHGITVGSNYAGSYKCEEYCVIIGLMSIMPEPVYNSQGIPRELTRFSRLEQFYPEFVNLSEQAILEKEIFFRENPNDNNKVFGYTGRYDEMRIRRSVVTADMRDTFSYWHLSRKFATAPALNTEFIECVPRKDIFAVQDEPGFIVSFGNKVLAYRPLPYQSEPGRLDHPY